MAFIREYAAMAGDPFRFRLPHIPRGLRKFQLGRAVGRAAGLAAGFVPGVGGAIGALRTIRLRDLAQQGIGAGLGYARGYGFDAGDPPPPGHHLAHAGAPPSHKSATTHAKQQHHLHGAAAHSHAKKQGKKGSHFDPHAANDALDAALRSGNVAGLIGQSASNILHQVSGTSITPEGVAAMHGHGGTGRHRRINPTNVKALRRSMRRVEGFEKLVKSVERMFPRLKRAHVHHHRHGHKPGCRCVACRGK